MYEDKKLINVLQINDWKFRNFICTIFAIQFATFGSIGLDVIGIHIPILRQLICFIYLTFVPGILILRSLKLHKLGNVETLLYATGLSISTLMFMGFFMNSIYPLLGINKPLSTEALIITITLVILTLCVISYIRDRDYSNPDFINISDIFSPYFLFLCLLPFICIFGTYLVNFYNNNVLLLILLLIISLIPVSITLNLFPKKYFQFTVLIISISLLYHRSLISMNLWGWDIHIEYHIAKLVIENSLWDSNLYSNVNSLLSITLLAPIFSIICDISLTWVFKIIYPSLFSLVPLGLYQITKKQTTDIIAFLSVFFFMSIFTYYGELTVLPRQEIAELFLVLLILLLVDVKMNKNINSVMAIFFGMALVVSHYAVTYLYVFSLILVWLLTNLMDNMEVKKILDFFDTLYYINNTNTTTSNNKQKYKLQSQNIIHKKLRASFVLIPLVFTITWYMYISSSSSFYTIVHVVNNVLTNISNDFFNSETAEGLSVTLAQTSSMLYLVLKYLHIVCQIFITVGIIKLVSKYKNMAFQKEYSIFSIINFGVCIGAIVLPYFASSITVTRLYHLTTIFLSPFCIIGGIYIISMIYSFFNKIGITMDIKNPSKVLSVFFTVFLLFNTGFVNEVTNSHPYSISLDNTLDYPRFNSQEISSAEWVNKMTNNPSLYADVFGRVLLTQYEYNLWKIGHFYGDTDKIPDGAYIYLRNLNVKGLIIVPAEKVSYERPYDYKNIKNSIFFTNVLFNKNLIYSNGGSEIYR